MDATSRDAEVAELRVVFGMLIRRLREESASGELTWSQGAVLSRLDRHGPSSVTELAKAESVRTQSMSATVASLEERGLIAGSRDPEDGRRTLLSATDAGRATLATERAAREDWLASAIHTHLSGTEQQQLLDAGKLIRKILEQ
ncbi:MarR family winged helix-turn-helix transcriptional regulator [Plantibacter sp. Mn2098]|uniref:MarR family winged helix-turn-helix transcriptional regulator n=1 Tax=Plantibacter sp. Mn2098 TaxID=3395266 RepID=UPI003BE913BF